jgi:hypothetical protein
MAHGLPTGETQIIDSAGDAVAVQDQNLQVQSTGIECLLSDILNELREIRFLLLER